MLPLIVPELSYIIGREGASLLADAESWCSR